MLKYPRVVLFNYPLSPGPSVLQRPFLRSTPNALSLRTWQGRVVVCWRNVERNRGPICMRPSSLGVGADKQLLPVLALLREISFVPVYPPRRSLDFLRSVSYFRRYFFRTSNNTRHDWAIERRCNQLFTWLFSSCYENEKGTAGALDRWRMDPRRRDTIDRNRWQPHQYPLVYYTNFHAVARAFDASVIISVRRLRSFRIPTHPAQFSNRFLSSFLLYRTGLLISSAINRFRAIGNSRAHRAL